jgi:uncharacterized protein YerC
MTLFQTLFNRLHTESGLIEITATEPDGILIHVDGSDYTSVNQLPEAYQLFISEKLNAIPHVFVIIGRAGFTGTEAIDRVLRCLYGAYDAMPDMDFNRAVANPEYPSHCSACKYDTPFCLNKIGILAPRESKIALLIKEGNTDKEIAGIVGTSEHTVRNQRRAIELKLRTATGSLVNATSISKYVTQYGG